MFFTDSVQLVEKAPNSTTCTRFWQKEDDIGRGHFGKVYIQRHTDPDTGDGGPRVVAALKSEFFHSFTENIDWSRIFDSILDTFPSYSSLVIF